MARTGRSPRSSRPRRRPRQLASPRQRPAMAPRRSRSRGRPRSGGRSPRRAPRTCSTTSSSVTLPSRRPSVKAKPGARRRERLEAERLEHAGRARVPRVRDHERLVRRGAPGSELPAFSACVLTATTLPWRDTRARDDGSGFAPTLGTGLSASGGGGVEPSIPCALAAFHDALLSPRPLLSALVAVAGGRGQRRDRRIQQGGPRPDRSSSASSRASRSLGAGGAVWPTPARSRPRASPPIHARSSSRWRRERTARRSSALNRDPRVAYAEPNFILHAADVVPNDPFFTAALGPAQHRPDRELHRGHARCRHRRARGVVGLHRQLRRRRRRHRHRRRHGPSGPRAEHLGQRGRGLPRLPHERRRRRRQRLRRRLARLGLRERRQQPDRRQRARHARRRHRCRNRQQRPRRRRRRRGARGSCRSSSWAPTAPARPTMRSARSSTRARKAFRS